MSTSSRRLVAAITFKQTSKLYNKAKRSRPQQSHGANYFPPQLLGKAINAPAAQSNAYNGVIYYIRPNFAWLHLHYCDWWRLYGINKAFKIQEALLGGVAVVGVIKAIKKASMQRRPQQCAEIQSARGKGDNFVEFTIFIVCVYEGLRNALKLCIKLH